jgi:hypothetical protein
MVKTLEELKAENAAAEATEPEVIEEVAEPTDVEVDTDLDDDPEVETDPDAEPDAEQEPWQEAAGDQGPEAQMMPVSAHVKAKHKFKGQISEKDNEIERLKAELEASRSGAQPAAQPGQLPAMPTLESCDHDEEKLQEAMTKWVGGVVQANIQSGNATASQAAAKQAQDKAVTDHYVRAEKLATESGIEPEAYKATDSLVREAVEAIRPGSGDLIVDQLIARVGEGSEKVVYYLGRNPAELAKVQNALASDPTGLSAAVLMGQLNVKIGSPTKRKPTAPDPAAQIVGDESPKGNANGKAFKRKYDEAVKKNDAQGRFDARRDARKAGVDVSTW